MLITEVAKLDLKINPNTVCDSVITLLKDRVRAMEDRPDLYLIGLKLFSSDFSGRTIAQRRLQIFCENTKGIFVVNIINMYTVGLKLEEIDLIMKRLGFTPCRNFHLLSGQCYIYNNELAYTVLKVEDSNKS